jgi:hypothetical protein
VTLLAEAGQLGPSGVDTCSFAFRPSSERFFDGLLARPHRPSAAGGVRFEQRGPGDTALLAWPAFGVVALEGRLAAVLANSGDCHDLVTKGRLHEGELLAQAALQELAGTPMHRDGAGMDGELRRYDLAAELRFESAPDGIAFMRTIATLTPPGKKRDVIGNEIPETVYFRTLKRMVVTERVYDKGRESGSDAPGKRIRVEAQRRPSKSKRRRSAVVGGMDLAADFGRTLLPYVGTEKLIAAGTEGATEHLVRQAVNGEVSMAKAERMIGTLALLKHYGRAVYPDARQQQRRLQQLRQAGIVLADELPDDHVVPVTQLLSQMIDTFTA